MAKVLCERRNRIGYITLNRPDALNALDDELNRELWAVWDEFASDEALDVAILTGAGTAFCSGAGLKTFIPKWENATMLDVRRNVATGVGGGLTRGQHRIKKPVIAAVNGHAIGGWFVHNAGGSAQTLRRPQPKAPSEEGGLDFAGIVIANCSGTCRHMAGTCLGQGFDLAECRSR